jgi:tripartite-type tricarboxylate transporter receptor subunit TctC
LSIAGLPVRAGKDVSMALRSTAPQRNATAGAAPLGGGADPYPARPVTLLLPFPLGGSTGYTASVLARGLAVALGQPFALEPRTGEYGIAALRHLRDNPDGYTLLVGNLTSNSMTPVFHAGKVGFDYLAEIAPISKLADFPSVVMTQLSAPADTLAGFLAHLKETTGTLVYGTDFLGAYVDVDAIALGKASSLKVAYHATNGADGILADLIAGRTDLAFINVATATRNIGKFKPLAVYGERRLPNFPDVPTMAEARYAGIGTGNWQGLFASRRTPAAIIDRLHRAVIMAMGTDAARQVFAAVNATIATSASPEAFAAEIRSEMVKWTQLKSEILALLQSTRPDHF